MSRRSESGRWFQTIPSSDRDVVSAMADWLRPVRWQWFVTLTFPWNVTYSTADYKLRSFTNAIERYHRTIIGYVAGKESRSRYDRGRVPWHFHLLITSPVQVSREALETLWLARIRRGSQSEADILRRGEHVTVERYQSHSLGPEYCLKTMNEDTGDWSMHRLEEFLPGNRGTARPNHRTVRRQRRAAAQGVAHAGPGTAAEDSRRC